MKKDRENGHKRPPKYKVIIIALIAICVGYNIWNCIDTCNNMFIYNNSIVGEVEKDSSEEAMSSDNKGDSNETENNESTSSEKSENKEKNESSSTRVIYSNKTPLTKLSLAKYVAQYILKAVFLSAFEILLLVFGGKFIVQLLDNSGWDEVISPEDSTISFSNIAGLDEVKEELRFLTDLMKGGDSSKDIRIPRGILLEGPPGNGKTMLAKAVAHDCNVNFIAMKASDIVNPFVGVASQRIQAVFNNAKRNTPCIIFIDEIDAIGSSRIQDPSGGVDKEENTTLTTLLNELDGFQELSGVLVIAATNMPDCLDPALIRPGRFDKRLEINNPNIYARRELLTMITKDIEFSNHPDINSLAARTSGFNCAEIQNVVNEARLIAIKESRDILFPEDIDKALLQSQIRGYESKKQDRKERDIETAAFHEAGHAIAGYYTGSKVISRISIRPTTSGAGGYTVTENAEELDFKPLSEIRDTMIMLYGGRAAEAKLRGTLDEISLGASQDIHSVTALASNYVMAQEGIDFTVFGSHGVKENMKCTRTVLEDIWNQSESIIESHWDEVKRVANILIERESIDSGEFIEIMNRSVA